MKLTILACLLLACLGACAQAPTATVAIVDSGQDCSIRGMSIPRDRVIWVSGNKGQVGRSTNGGKTWKWMVVPGYEKTDFRDIHAFDSGTAIIMGIDNPAYILKTRDGGQSWKLVYTKDTTGMFLDAMDFRNDKEGICIGDPIDAGAGKRTFFVIRTNDGGDSWQQERSERLPPAQQGEAVFSASGTNIALLNNKHYEYAFISGGLASSLYLIGRKDRPNMVHALRIAKGKESAGAFSMATDRKGKFYCIGGDYKNPGAMKDNFAWTTDKGESWNTPAIAPPYGYRSCIRIIEGDKMAACGSNGVDMCAEPNKWERISGEGFNVCMVSPDKKVIFFAGGKGKIGMLRL
jgi:photosystem II stability/assembly factor-like uncharacterized protein